MQKGNRGIAVTVKELVESVRLRIAVDAYKAGDSSFLKAILIEYGLEVFQATKSSITKIVGKSYSKGYAGENGETIGKGLDAFELIPYLRSLDTDILNNMNVFWGLSDPERELYLGDIKGTLPEEKKKELLERVKRRFGLD